MASLQLCVLRGNSIAHLDAVVYGVDSRCAKANAIVEIMLKYICSCHQWVIMCVHKQQHNVNRQLSFLVVSKLFH